MTSFDEVVYLRERVHSLCAGLKWRLREYVAEFPAGSPTALIAYVEAFIEETEASLTGIADVTQLQFYFSVVESLTSTLNFLDNAHSAQTPRGLVQVLEKTAKALFPGASFLVAPSAEYNYSIVDLVPSLTKLANSALPAAKSQAVMALLPKQFYLVQFPRIERENILNHAIFGHEFGHPIADIFLQVHEQETSYQQCLLDARNKVEAHPVISAELGKVADPIEKAKYRNQLSEAISNIHRRGIQELVSDIVGLYLFGPSAVFASLDVLLAADLDASPVQPTNYPPSRYRLRLLKKGLDDGKFIEAFNALDLASQSLKAVAEATKTSLDYLEAIASVTTDLDGLKHSPLTDAAYHWVTLTLPSALTFASKTVSDAGLMYSSVMMAAELPDLLSRLDVEVPPNEVGTWPDLRPADWRSALTASWLFRLRHSLDTSLSDHERRDRVLSTQLLALKGVEYSILQAEYVEHRKGIKAP